MSAFDLLDMEDPPLTCCLCKDGEMAATEDVSIPVSALIQYQNVVHSGVCYSNGNRLEHCALQSTEYTSQGWMFKSTIELKN